MTGVLCTVCGAQVYLTNDYRMGLRHQYLKMIHVFYLSSKNF